jgi:exonuclease III
VSAGFLHCPPSFQPLHLNIRSMLNTFHTIALHDLLLTHQPDLIALTETWITPPFTTASQLINSTPHGYTLLSIPRPCTTCPPNSNLGGGTVFLIREPSRIHPSFHSPDKIAFTSFELLSVTLALPSSKLTVFNIYCPPGSSDSQPFSVFLDQFQTFLSSALTTPHEYLFTGDFNIPVNNLLDPNTKQFLALLSLNLTQHIQSPLAYTCTSPITLSISSSPYLIQDYLQLSFNPSASLLTTYLPSLLLTSPPHLALHLLFILFIV